MPQPLVLPSGNDGHLVRTRQRAGDRPQLLFRVLRPPLIRGQADVPVTLTFGDEAR
jgi:hypothetical protein